MTFGGFIIVSAAVVIFGLFFLALLGTLFNPYSHKLHEDTVSAPVGISGITKTKFKNDPFVDGYSFYLNGIYFEISRAVCIAERIIYHGETVTIMNAYVDKVTKIAFLVSADVYLEESGNPMIPNVRNIEHSMAVTKYNVENLLNIIQYNGPYDSAIKSISYKDIDYTEFHRERASAIEHAIVQPVGDMAA